MPLLLRRADNLLRGKSAFEPTAAVWFLLILGGMIYGGVMGSYGLEREVRPWQIAFSAIKTPLLLLVTFAISLPSFFVLNTLFGVRNDFGQVLKALATSQASLTLVLASLSPYTALWYASFKSYFDAVLFNGFMFGVASLAGQAMLRKAYRPLISNNARHRWLLWIWLALYAFVGIQMGWSLRPFIGYPGTAVEFLRESDGDNVYVIVFNTLRRL